METDNLINDPPKSGFFYFSVSDQRSDYGKLSFRSSDYQRGTKEDAIFTSNIRIKHRYKLIGQSRP